VNGTDVGVVEGGGRTGFSLESFESLIVFGESFGQELEGHETAELSVLGLIHHTHTTAAELFQDAIVGNGRTNHMERNPSLAGILLYARR
jgi:hypothetical protein